MLALSLDLPNGKICCLASAGMRRSATFVSREIFDKQCYLHPGFELRPTDTVIDIGAHVGLFMLWAAPQVPRGRIVSVEPNEAAFRCLESNITGNGIANAVALRAAVGREGGMAEIVFRPGLEPLGYCTDARPPWFYRNETPASRLWLRLLAWAANPGKVVPPMQRVTAPRMTLGDIMDGQRLAMVNFLKIDCEGCEYQILENTRPEQWRRIERIVLEYHESPRDGRFRAELVSALEDNGFEVETASRWRLFGAEFGKLWARNLAPAWPAIATG